MDDAEGCIQTREYQSIFDKYDSIASKLAKFHM